MALVADELRLRLISLVAIRAVHVTEVAVMRIRIKIFRHLGGSTVFGRIAGREMAARAKAAK
mgnify:CR=1 FL=1